MEVVNGQYIVVRAGDEAAFNRHIDYLDWNPVNRCTEKARAGLTTLAAGRSVALSPSRVIRSSLNRGDQLFEVRSAFGDWEQIDELKSIQSACRVDLDRRNRAIGKADRN